jgi:hypothetical protein
MPQNLNVGFPNSFKVHEIEIILHEVFLLLRDQLVMKTICVEDSKTLLAVHPDTYSSTCPPGHTSVFLWAS